MPPLPLGRPWQKLFYWISLNHTEILIFIYVLPLIIKKIEILHSPLLAPGKKLFVRIYLIDMKIFLFKFEGPISNNKEIEILPPLPPWTPLAKKIFFWISLIYMEILLFKFEGPIPNNKENKNFVPPPRDAPGNFFCFFLISLMYMKF